MTIFSANQLKFDKDYLNELTSDPNSGVFKQKCKYHVALHPAQFNDFGESLKDELGKKIGRFDESFQGIMLGYENIKLQSQLGVIGSDNCYVHLDIEALFYVFHPRIDMVLKGTVTRTTKDHVGCLVYNTFNISLPKPAEDETWLGENVAIKSEVSFKITFVNLTARLPHIRGDLLSIESQGDISGVSLIKTEKKGKKTKFEDEEEVGEIEKKPHKEKRKKRSSLSVIENPTTEPEVEEEMETPKKTKRKKSISTSMIDESVLYADEAAVENGDISTNKTKKKKNKFKDYYSETEVTAPTTKSEKKKRKKSTSFSIGENSLHTELIIKDEIKEEEVTLTPTKYKDSDKSKTKKNKKKKNKQENDDLDISLESLDIKSLFTENMTFDENSSQNMADGPDKKRKRRKSQSISHHEDLYLDSVKLEPDSDLEKIIGKKEKKGKS